MADQDHRAAMVEALEVVEPRGSDVRVGDSSGHGRGRAPGVLPVSRCEDAAVLREAGRLEQRDRALGGVDVEIGQGDGCSLTVG